MSINTGSTTGGLVTAVVLLASVLPTAVAGPRTNPLLDPGYADTLDKGIYGDDDRIELYQATPDAQAAAAATAGFFLPGALERTQGGWRVRDELRVPMRERDLSKPCPQERFSEQPAVAYCSGFLIDQDILATAGHCVGGRSPPCEDVQLVFGYALTGDGDVRLEYPESDVYRCREVIAQAHDENQHRDWAVLRLDRPVIGRTPFTVWVDQPPRDEELVVIGHPRGLPSKIAAGGRVQGNDAEAPWFRTNLDTYQGNSGSGVFTLSSIQRGVPEVVGILVAGASDFMETDEGCAVSRRFPDASGADVGEWVTKAIWMLDDVPRELIDEPEPPTESDGVRLQEELMKLIQ